MRSYEQKVGRYETLSRGGSVLRNERMGMCAPTILRTNECSYPKKNAQAEGRSTVPGWRKDER